MIILQHIQTEWSKLSRGHPESKDRNATPEALEIPMPISSYDVCLHEITFKEEDSFYPRSRIITDPDKDVSSKLAISFRKFEKKLVFNFCWSWHYVGAPERRNSEIFTLMEGQSGRIRFNGRFGAQSTTGQEWIYRKNVINAYYGRTSNSRIFIENDPYKHFDSFENLQ